MNYRNLYRSHWGAKGAGGLELPPKIWTSHRSSSNLGLNNSKAGSAIVYAWRFSRVCLQFELEHQMVAGIFRGLTSLQVLTLNVKTDEVSFWKFLSIFWYEKLRDSFESRKTLLEHKHGNIVLFITSNWAHSMEVSTLSWSDVQN